MVMPATPNPDVVITSTTGTEQDITDAIAAQTGKVAAAAAPVDDKAPVTTKVDDKTPPADGKVDDKAASDAGRTLNERRRNKDDESSKVAERVGKLGYEKHVAIARAETAEATVAQLKAELASRPAAPTTAQPASLRPKPVYDADKYRTYEDWVEDLTDWKADEKAAKTEAKAVAAVDSKLSERDQADAARANQDLAQRLDTEFKARAAEFLKATPDYNDVVEAATDFVVPPPVHAAIMHSELGPDIVYHLITHPDEHAKLMQMGQGAMVKTIGRIEERLERAKEKAVADAAAAAEKAKAAPATGGAAFAAPAGTQLPAPPSPVGAGRNDTAVVFTETGDGWRDFRAKRNAEIKEQGRRY